MLLLLLLRHYVVAIGVTFLIKVGAYMASAKRVPITGPEVGAPARSRSEPLVRVAGSEHPEDEL